MKKRIALLLTTFLAITFETYAQCSAPTISSTQTVYTAKNSAVQGLILTPLSSQCYNDAVNYRHDTYPNSIVVDSAKKWKFKWRGLGTGSNIYPLQ
jgi:hypothetical protein